MTSTPSPRLRSAHAVAMVLAVCTATCVHAQAGPERWTQLQLQLAANNKLRANAITSTYSIPGDDANITGAYKTIAQAAVLNSEPARALASRSKESDLGMKFAAMSFGLPERFANYPAELFPDADSVELAGQENIDGASFSLIKIHARSVKGNLPITATVWINDKTAQPLRVRGVIDKSPLPGNKTIHFSVAYASDGQGRSLPTDVAVNFTVAAFFHTGELAFTHHLADWHATSQ